MKPAAKARVAVVGAGIAGFAAALRLQERGFDVTLFEQRVYSGGKLGAHSRRILRVDVETGQRRAPPRCACRLSFDEFDELLAGLDADENPLGPVRTLLARERERQARALNYAHPQRRQAEAQSEPTTEWRSTYDPASQRHGARRAWRVDTPGQRYIVRLYRPRNVSPRLEISDGLYHEHCYHMFLNWYHNFWQLMHDASVAQAQWFQPKQDIVHVFPGATALAQRSRQLRQPGTLGTIAQNMLCGAESPADTFLWFYSMLDLSAQRLAPQRLLDQISVAGLLSSRWYATDACAAFHEHLLTKAFAIPTYLSSAAAFQNFLSFTAQDANPLLWVLNTNSYEGIFAPLERRFVALGGTLRLGEQVTALLDSGNRIAGLLSEPADMMGDARRDDDGEDYDDHTDYIHGSELPQPDEFEFVVLAVPPATLARLIEPLRERLPSVSGVRKLQSGSTACLDLYFTRKLDQIPAVHTVLRESRLGLTFIDNSQLWPQANMGAPTHLSVAATNYALVEGMSKQEATDAIIDDLRRFIAFERTDIDAKRSYLQLNATEPLFVNEVGSEVFQPPTRTDLSNLFLAGDFCDNPIGIVTVEAAVTSGLLAARAVQSAWASCADSYAQPEWEARMRPIAVIEPQRPPRAQFRAGKLALAPYAAAAKVWARCDEIYRDPALLASPRIWSAIGMDLCSLPGAYAADCWDLAVDTARWMLDGRTD